MRSIDTAERRARLARRHHLAEPAGDVEQVAADLVGLHSSDPATVYLSARARLDGFETGDLETALYEDRTLARMVGMRRTMFVVPLDLAEVMVAACARALVPGERRRLVGFVADQLVPDGAEEWLADVEDRVVAALAERGEAVATELTEDVPELGLRFRFGEGKKWGGEVGVSTRVLFLLSTDARIVRARPRGSWLSSQYRWAPTEHWLGRPLVELDDGEARAELLRRWLATFGPGTLDDVRWWTGWTVALTKAALAAVDAVEVRLDDDSAGWVLSDDVDPVEPVDGDWVALLPGLDPTVMGWKARDWYLGPHAERLFDRNGNAGPTVWHAGRVVGGWAQSPTGEVVVEVFDDVGAGATEAVAAEAARLTGWLAGTVVTPRFRSPLERELSGS